MSYVEGEKWAAWRPPRNIRWPCLLRSCTGIRMLGGRVPVRLLQNQSGNFFDAAEVLDLKVCDVDMGVELLFDMQQQLHKSLRVKKPGIEQIRIDRRNVKVQSLRKQGGEPGLYDLVIRVGSGQIHNLVALH